MTFHLFQKGLKSNLFFIFYSVFVQASFEGGTNKFWQSLYQETFRFLTEGTVDVDHLHVTSQDPALPQVQALKTPALSVA